MTKNPILIIGGGISGLSTAWFLHKKGEKVILLESRDRVGGNIRTSRNPEGYLIEHGPNSTLQKPGDEEDALGRIITDMALESELQEANPLAARRFVMKGGQLHVLPTSPPGFIKTPLFSLSAKLRLCLEPFIGKSEQEESIAQFVIRRLGQEFLDYAIEPFVSGVYAGDPKQLSVRAAVAKIYALEAKYGSLIKGAIALGKIRKAAGMPRGRMISFETGMETLPATIANRLPHQSIHTNAQVTALCQHGAAWQVSWQQGGQHGGEPHSIIASQVVLATPASVSAQLLRPLSPQAADLLESIRYAPVDSVALGYAKQDINHSLDGFGFLIPRKEQVTTLGGLFSTTLFPGRAPQDKALLTCFIGGMTNPSITQWSEEKVVTQVDQDMMAALGIQHGAEYVHLTRYTHAIAQYEQGHLQRVGDIDRALAGYKGLHLRANWRDGVSVSDCVLNGEKSAQKILAGVS
ncbi:protoporphyrinogen oxidase [Magnetococcus marinus MC-1]|uniref:Protoporphyrinogen oxidase n=1 Tax=Magnetococcus marinus (strain ATCC BAA-1437 / JCM 17883 / MC-1) TaxID=156889 RepID=A0L3L3_MAGMM|nr:protoporphyrinogen oxidase [Magnetococcus marinus]ABK42556.1 protoporphyrinogen oxidase [Magnetococcus marinus MC-1]